MAQNQNNVPMALAPPRRGARQGGRRAVGREDAAAGRLALLQMLDPTGEGKGAGAAFEKAKKMNPSVSELAVVMLIKLGYKQETALAFLKESGDHQHVKSAFAELNGIIQRKAITPPREDHIRELLNCNRDEIKRLASEKNEVHKLVTWFTVLSCLVNDPLITGIKQYKKGAIGVLVRDGEPQFLNILSAKDFMHQALQLLKITSAYNTGVRVHLLPYDREDHIAALILASHCRLTVRGEPHYTVVQESRFSAVKYSDLTPASVVDFMAKWYNSTASKIASEIVKLNGLPTAPGVDDDTNSKAGTLPNYLMCAKYYRKQLPNLYAAVRATLKMVMMCRDDPDYAVLISPGADLSEAARIWRQTVAANRMGHDAAFQSYKELQKASAVSIGDHKLYQEFVNSRISDYCHFPLPKSFDKALGLAYTFKQVQEAMQTSTGTQYEEVIIVAEGSEVGARIIRQYSDAGVKVCLAFEGLGGRGGAGIEQISVSEWPTFKARVAWSAAPSADPAKPPAKPVGVRKLVIIEQVPPSFYANLEVDVNNKALKFPRMLRQLLANSDADIFAGHNLSYAETYNELLNAQAAFRNFQIHCYDHMRGRNDRFYFHLRMLRDETGKKLATTVNAASRALDGPLADDQILANAALVQDFLTEKIYRATIASDMRSFSYQAAYDYMNFDDNEEPEDFDNPKFVPAERPVDLDDDFISEPLHFAFYDRALKTLTVKPKKDDKTLDMWKFARDFAEQRAAAEAKARAAALIAAGNMEVEEEIDVVGVDGEQAPPKKQRGGEADDEAALDE